MAYYWNKHEKDQGDALRPWIQTGDKYTRTRTATMVLRSRDDMLKVADLGLAVEVEATLVRQRRGARGGGGRREDTDRFIKPQASSS